MFSWPPVLSYDFRDHMTPRARALASILPRLVRGASEELRGLVSRRLFADVASALPNRALARTRTALFRAAGVQVGAHSLIQGPMRITGNDNPCALLTIGDNVMITGGLHLDLGAPISIGDHVRIGHDVSLLTISHDTHDAWFRAGESFARRIEIGRGCWLASRCVVLPGVVLDRGCIVAAGAVVTKSFPKNSLIAGIPGRLVRDLGDS
jgi:maltose O-acetyltransferase